MFSQAQSLKRGSCIGFQDFIWSFSGKYRKQDGNQSPHDVGVAVTHEG